ncbi:MAG: hypothetical protein ACJART_001528 [Maribacter sp.]|jgi:hypothetical protein
MKKSVTLITAFVLVFNFTIAQNSCSKFYPMEEGTSFQYTNYDKKGKTEGVLNYTISSVTDNGSSTTATFDMKFVDKKGKDVFNSNYNITCENGVIRIDYKSLFPSQMMQQYTEMGIEMDITGTDIEIPNDLSVGQDLADANVSIAMSMSGIKMNTTVNQTNRKVEKKESITVAAGTFDCYLVTETNISKTMGANIEMNTKQWLAEGVGMVKQESYKKNGNLMSRMELTKFSK